MAVNLRILIENEFSTDGRGLPYKNDGGGGVACRKCSKQSCFLTIRRSKVPNPLPSPTLFLLLIVHNKLNGKTGSFLNQNLTPLVSFNSIPNISKNVSPALIGKHPQSSITFG